MSTSGTEGQGTPSGGSEDTMPFRKLKVTKVKAEGACTLASGAAEWLDFSVAGVQDFPEGQWVNDLRVTANGGSSLITVYYE